MISEFNKEYLKSMLVTFANDNYIDIDITNDPMNDDITGFKFCLNESHICTIYICWSMADNNIHELFDDISKKVLNEMRKHNEERMRVSNEILEFFNAMEETSSKRLQGNITTGYRYVDEGESYLPAIQKVIFNDPATIVIWADGTKTVVKCDCELYDPEKGLAMAISKKTLGNNGNYYETFKKWVPEKPKPIDILQDMYRKKTKKRSR